MTMPFSLPFKATSKENVLALGKTLLVVRSDSVIIPGTPLWIKIATFLDSAVKSGTMAVKELLTSGMAYVAYFPLRSYSEIYMNTDSHFMFQLCINPE